MSVTSIDTGSARDGRGEGNVNVLKCMKSEKYLENLKLYEEKEGSKWKANPIQWNKLGDSGEFWSMGSCEARL